MKQKRILINYADEKFFPAQNLCSRTGKLIGGFDEVISYTPGDIDDDFANKNKRILENRRGAGLWLWKPFFIDKTLKQIDNGEYLFYCDSGAFFVRNISHIISSMNQDIWVAELPLVEHQWTKSYCFGAMDMDKAIYRDSNQIQASFLCIRKSNFSISFVKEWLELCCKYDLISPEKNTHWLVEEYPEFIAHREDQSILSLLCKRDGIKPHKDPSQFGRYPEGYKQPGYIYKVPDHPEDRYKTILVLHRLQSMSKKAFIRHCLIACTPQRFSDYIYWRHKR